MGDDYEYVRDGVHSVSCGRYRETGRNGAPVLENVHMWKALIVRARPLDTLIDFDAAQFENNCVIIVSMLAAPLVAQKVRGRGIRVFSPHTGPDYVLRDAKGNITGVRALLEHTL